MPSIIRRVLLWLCAVAIAWAVLVLLTGGFAFSLRSLRLSSHTIVNPLLVALLAFGAAAALPGADKSRPPWTSGPLHPAALAALTGTLLFVYQWAVARPLWLDEEMIAINIRDRGLADLARGLWLGQSAPFGWLALQRSAFILLGDGERALRLVPILFAAATLGGAVAIGRRWLGVPGGTLLVLLCSFGQWLTYYCLELKHYSADIFWALALPAAAAWAIEALDDTAILRRLVAWWGAAALGQWFANGALLVTPGCALVLAVLVWRRHGRRSALIFAAAGAIWLGAFGLHYLVAIRHALENRFLETYWVFAFPPSSAGLAVTFGWLWERLAPLALKPGGTSLWLALWVAAGAGFVFGRRPHLGALFASVPVSALLLASCRLVPLYERLSLWVVPALYVGIALLLDAAVDTLHRRPSQASWRRAALATGAAILALLVSADIVRRGVFDLRHGRPSRNNHQLDDRAAVDWLIAQRRPQDLLVTTHLGLPALWWYGRVPIGDATGGGRQTPEGTRIIEASFRPRGRDCRDRSVTASLIGARRAVIYFGFRFDDVPKGFDELLLADLGAHGVIARVQDFAPASRVTIVELHESSSTASPSSTAGCIVMEPAMRW